MKVPVVQNILKLNDEIAAANREFLEQAGVLTIDLMGAPGCGKTSLLEATIQRLPNHRIGILCGDPSTQRDADRLARLCPDVVQINTGNGCHLEAHHVRKALSRLDVHELDLLFIENVGNLICPVGFDLGQALKVGMFAVCGGDDKPAKHPHIVTESSVLLLSKTDLLPHVPFDLNRFRSDVRRLNLDVSLLELSVTSGDGLDSWLDWLRAKLLSTEPVLSL
jgi:hydrogenase nickel incorporation protein HypB